MLVLGLHFGHDANMTLLRDGGVLGFFEKERHSRVKQALGLSVDDVLGFLGRHGVGTGDLDCCALTSTQGVPIADWDGRLEIEATGTRRVAVTRRDGSPFFRDLLPAAHPYRDRIAWLPEARREAARGEILAGEDFALAGSPGEPHELMQEVSVAIAGRRLRRAYFVGHHLAHAQYAASFGPFRRALVVTFDGMTATDWSGGGVFCATGDMCRPLLPHGFWCGSFYVRVGERLGLGLAGGAGKLMGLAGYGVPCFADPALTGPIDGPTLAGRFRNGTEVADAWLDAIGPLPDWDGWSAPPAAIADVARSAQAVFEANVLALMKRAREAAAAAGFAHDGICLSGGCALNCPSNTLVARAHGPVFVPPAVNDEGLSLGAAIAVAPDWRRPPVTPAIAYLGPVHAGAEAAEAPARDAGLPVLARGEEAIVRLARGLLDGQVAGFFHGGAEVGPRALGHRSILASPLAVAMRDRVNAAKQREPWRPLAPVCPAERCGDYFSHLPADGHFMLFNAIGRTSLLPAVTHVDGTARVQAATEACGPLHALLGAFGRLSGHPVLLNTSFNGRGEPIVETPRDAVRAFLRMPLDLLYLEGTLFGRPASDQAKSERTTGSTWPA